MVCPNPNHPDWIALVNKIGEQKAYEAFVRHGEQIPNPDLFPDLNLKTEDVTFNPQNDKPLSTGTLTKVATKLKEKFNVNFQIVNLKNAERLYGKEIPKGLQSFWKSDTNTVVFIEGRAGYYTAIHEFSHPFVRYIKQANATVFQGLKNQATSFIKDKYGSTPEEFLLAKGYSNRVVNGQITENGWEEIITHAVELTTKAIVDNDGSLENFKPTLINFVVKFWKKVGEMLKSLFPKSNLNPEYIRSVASLNLEDIASFMMDIESTLDLSYIRTEFPEVFERLDLTTSTAYSQQINDYKSRTGKDLSTKQFETLNTIISKQNLKLSDDRKTYSDGVNTLQRVTDYLNSLEGPNDEPSYYIFRGAEDDYADSRERGSQVDDVVQGIIEGLDLESTINKVHSNAAERKVGNTAIKDVEIEENLLKEVYNEVKSLLETQYRDHIILSQVQLYDVKSKIAGTADLVLIDRDGKVTILDVKSSIKSTLDAAYRKQFVLKETGEKAASSYQRYSAQTSVYKALGMTMGLRFTDTTYDLGIVPIYFSKIDDTGSPEELNVEPVLNLAAYEYIIDKFVPKNALTVEDLNLKSREGALIEQIKMVLTERYDQIKNVRKKYFESKEIQQLIELLDTTEKTKVLNLFIDQVYDMLVSKELPNGKLKPGLSSEIKNISRDLTNSKIDVKEAINRFMVIKQTVEMFTPLIESLNAFKRSNISYMDTIDNPVFNKINHCISALSEINKTYENEVVYYLADILYENGISKKANQDVKEEVDFQKKKIEEVRKTNPKKADMLQKTLDKRIMFLRSEEGVTKNVLIKSLKEGSSEDISSVDLLLTSAISSSNELLASFAKTLKNDLENARQELLSFERTAAIAFEDYNKATSVSQNNVADFNRPFYEEVNVFDKMSPEGEPMFKKQTRFVSNIDFNAYNKVYANYIKLLNEAKTPADRTALRKAFVKSYKKVRPQEDVVIKNPYTNKEAVIVKGIKSLIAEQRLLFEKNLITETQLNNYISRTEGIIENGEYVYDDAFMMIDPDKFKNAKYEALSGATKKYYNFLVSSHFESQVDLPSKLGYRLPAIVKTGLDQLKENGIKDYFMYKWEYFKKRQKEEIQRYGSDTKEIPMIYNIEIDPELVNLDLVSSIVAYRGFSLDYGAKQDNLSTGEALLDMARAHPPTKTDSLGNRYLDSVASKLGIKDEALKYYKDKLGNNNIAALLAIFIDTQIYGKHNVESVYNIFGKSVDMNKLTDSIMSFAAVTQLGGINPLPALVNYMQGNVQASIEAFGGQFFSDKDWLQSRVEYDRSILDYIKDFANPVNKTFMGQLIDTIDPMQGEYKDAAGRKISQSVFKKMWSSNTWFFLQHQGEHSIQIRTMIAVLLKEKVKDSSGKEVSMYKAYQDNFKKTGQISLNGYFTEDKLSENGKISRDTQDKLHALNKRMHGIYNSFDKPALERHAIGRLLIMYRKFLVPGLKRRYKRLGLDQELGTFTEGYYNTFFEKLIKDTKKLVRFYMGLEKNGFSPHEKQNLKRAAREMMIVFATGLAVILISSLLGDTDDEDEKRVLRRFLFVAMKLNQELGIYLTFGDPQNPLLTPNIREFYNNLKGVSAITGTTDRFVKLIQQLFEPTEVYQKDTGVFGKGDSKLFAAFLKFWGITGVNFDPEESIKYMKMKQ
jgi:hypothetical protein